MRRKRAPRGLVSRRREGLGAWSVLLEGRLHGALEPGRDLQQLAGGDHIAIDVELSHTLGEVLRGRALESRYAGRRQMTKEDIATMALDRSDRRTETAPQNVGAEIVDRDLVVSLLL